MAGDVSSFIYLAFERSREFSEDFSSCIYDYEEEEEEEEFFEAWNKMLEKCDLREKECST